MPQKAEIISLEKLLIFFLMKGIFTLGLPYTAEITGPCSLTFPFPTYPPKPQPHKQPFLVRHLGTSSCLHAKKLPPSDCHMSHVRVFQTENHNI